MLVKLSKREHFIAVQVGMLRQHLSVGKGEQTQQYDGLGYDNHIIGALGEYAVAKALRLFWTGLEDTGTCDVAPLQVRTVTNPILRLRIMETDPDSDVYVLVELVNPFLFNVIGWIPSWEGKKSLFWSNTHRGTPAFLVPRSVLYPMTSVPRSDEEVESLRR